MENKLKTKLKPGVVFVLLFSAYMIVNTINLARFKTNMYDVENNANINFIYLIIFTAAVFAALFVLRAVFARIENFYKYILFFSSVCFAVGLVANKNLDIAYNAAVLAVLFYVVRYCFLGGGESEPESDIPDSGEKSGPGSAIPLILIAALAAAYTAIVGFACVLRHKAFCASTFDFGIFAQMFENMAKTGLQLTSVERNMHISHFAVHFSPIYYVILPFYMLFRTPESLLVIQAAAAASGVFPLCMIAKKFKLSNMQTLLVAAAYLLYPALTGGLFFDFHENKFLTVLIFWILYFIISDDANVLRKYILIYLFAALVLIVKEDSFLYVFCIALYMISIKKDGKYIKNNIINGIAIAGISILYFIFVTYYLNTYGLGVMTWRFNLFLRAGESGFLNIIVNVLKSPALLLSSLLSVPEKLEFLLYMFIPLCFLPFTGKRLNFIILMVPMVIMNLATDYIYQYNINFQYTYGVTPILFFLAVCNLSKIKTEHIKKICVAMACFSLVLFTSKNFNRFHSYYHIYNNYKDDFIETTEMLKQIPPDASVSAGTFIVPHLIRRGNLYMVDIGGENYFDYGTEYLVNDMRGVDPENYRDFLREIERHGYKKIDSGVFIEIFKKAGDGEEW